VAAALHWRPVLIDARHGLESRVTQANGFACLTAYAEFEISYSSL
jgi:hypothetical protein